MTPRRSFVPLLFLVLAISAHALADETKPANPDLAEADQLYKSGKFADAADKYQAILKTDPKLVPAEAGLIRSLLRQQQVEEAFHAASAAVTEQPNAAALQCAMGEVRFRRGEMPEAETAYRRALELDSRQAQAYLGLARLYRVYSLNRHAYDELQQAHNVAPNDPEVQRAWLRQLPRKERIAALEAYLASPHPDSPEETTRLQSYLDFLKATVDRPVHACRLVSHVDQTDTKLEAMRRDPTHIVGYGFVVRLNDHNARLLLDTGASGITLTHKAAEKAGVSRLSAINISGIGDNGPQNGYLAVADHIRVGELEFADCIVAVSDRGSIADEDGLIGGDVFQHYLVDIDMPGEKLRLSPLPKRPDETTPAPTGLSSEGESAGNPDEKSESADEQRSATAEAANKSSAPAPQHLPHDRYIAPEMEKWTPVFRFGHLLLIYTSVNQSPTMLFAIDTGAFANAISKDAAAKVSKISADPFTKVKGLSGSVSDVYRADKATLVFGHLAQKNQGIVVFDLSKISRRVGTEVSGFLGFNLLHMLQIKIDYRDGLVDFVYDTNRFGTGTR